MGCGFGIAEPGRNREPGPYRTLRVLETSRTDPAVLDRRVNIWRVRGRAGHTGETKCAVVRPYDRAGFLAELDESCIAKGKPCLIQGIEFFKDQECDRLAEIQRRLADRAKQIAGIKFRNAAADLREVFRRHHHRWLQRAAEAREIHASVDVRCIGGADKNGMRCRSRPPGEICGTKIRGVEFCTSDLGDAVNAASAVRRRIPVLSSGQSLPRCESGFLSRSQPRHAERDAARRHPLHELASRRLHAPTSWSTLSRAY